jgi:hypothetical protein
MERLLAKVAASPTGPAPKSYSLGDVEAQVIASETAKNPAPEKLALWRSEWEVLRANCAKAAAEHARRKWMLIPGVF